MNTAIVSKFQLKPTEDAEIWEYKDGVKVKELESGKPSIPNKVVFYNDKNINIPMNIDFALKMPIRVLELSLMSP